MPHLSFRFILNVFISLCLFSSPALADKQSTPSIDFHYNRSSNTLKLNVLNIELKQLLTTIAYKTGLEILFDDKANEKVSLTVKDQPLQQALKNILRGKNYSFHYSKTKNQTLLTSLTVLPSNTNSKRDAFLLNKVSKEATLYTRQNLSLDQSNRLDIALERWNSRLARLNPEQKDSLEQNAIKRIKTEDTLNKRREEREAANKKNRIKRDAFFSEKNNTIINNHTEHQKQHSEHIRSSIQSQLVNQLTLAK